MTLESNKEQTNKHHIVGIGASAGGLEALEQFFRNTPDNTGASFIIVQHLSPDYKSLLVELIGRFTKMPTLSVKDSMEVLPNTIYIIPPKKNMTIFNGVLHLDEQDKKLGLNLPIDIFLRSLAEDQGKMSISVILSGTGSDGTLGIRAIKEAGGIVMVQDENTAKFDGMPRSSIATGLVDFVAPADELPNRLVNFLKHPVIKKSLSESQSIISKTDETYIQKIIKIIKDTVGVDFTHYKPNTVIRRIEKRISINQLTGISDYLEFIKQAPQEAKILYKELLIGVTRFFRDNEAFDIIEKEIIPKLTDNKKTDTPLRLWTLGCSTGEEAYSLAILLKNYLDKHNINLDVKIFATDLDKKAIEFAGMGIYSESIISDVPKEFLKLYFKQRENGGYQINETIRKMVIFATHNIIKDPPFTKMDFVSCRNMLIYLKSNMQQKVLSMLYYSLNKPGYLFLGSSETLGDVEDGFSTINRKWKIYEAKEGYIPPTGNHIIFPTVGQLSNKNLSVGNTLYAPKKINDSLDDLFEKILSKYISSCIIVDSKFNILHSIGTPEKYLNIPKGRITYNILKLIREDLSVVLGTILHKAQKENQEIVFKDIQEKANEKHLDIYAFPIKNKNGDEKHFAIIINEKEKQKHTPNTAQQFDAKKQMNERIKELETDLQYSKENLQATIEELETSNEELQSTNEELIASNEELQSTNEELQSVNEELYTVNSEYQSKIEELTELNNDVTNLLKNTNIGVLFLDSRLRIRKFTPGITSIINIMDMDIGRPIYHISHKTGNSKFFDEVEGVLNDLIPKEMEVIDDNNNYFLLKILPYRTPENAVEGLVLTLININKLKREQELLVRVLENNPIANVILDINGHFTYANKKAQELLEITQEDIVKMRFNKLTFEIKDIDGEVIPDDKLPFSLLKSTGKNINNYRHKICWKNGKEKNIETNGAPIFDDNKNVVGAVFSIQEI